MAEHAFRRTESRVFGQVLAIHDQVLPVHVHLDVLEPQGSQRESHMQGHADVAHVDLHRGLRVPVLEEQKIPRSDTVRQLGRCRR